MCRLKESSEEEDRSHDWAAGWSSLPNTKARLSSLATDIVIGWGVDGDQRIKKGGIPGVEDRWQTYAFGEKETVKESPPSLLACFLLLASNTWIGKIDPLNYDKKSRL